MNADGSNQRRLTRNGAQDSNPTWAPNSRKIAFQSDLSGDFEIWVRADGTAPHQLTRG
jgi:Tol biopolymer transport system component